MDSLILTARLQPEFQEFFDQLRQRHFPPERNFVPAHLTLFHALPQANQSEISSQLLDVVRNEPPIEGHTVKLLNLGRGVAFSVESPRLACLRSQLAELWSTELTAQDRQTPRLHITVQNKVAPEAARALLTELNRDFEPRTLLFEGMNLWRYLNGPWGFVQAFSFTERNLY